LVKIPADAWHFASAKLRNNEICRRIKPFSNEKDGLHH
jgi:hypothetical protein